jgi:hypothetical protein
MGVLCGICFPKLEGDMTRPPEQRQGEVGHGQRSLLGDRQTFKCPCSSPVVVKIPTLFCTVPHILTMVWNSRHKMTLADVWLCT